MAALAGWVSGGERPAGLLGNATGSRREEWGGRQGAGRERRGREEGAGAGTGGRLLLLQGGAGHRPVLQLLSHCVRTTLRTGNCTLFTLHLQCTAHWNMVTTSHCILANTHWTLDTGLSKCQKNYTSIIQDQNCTPKKCMEPVLNTHIPNILPITNWPATPFPQYIN